MIALTPVIKEYIKLLFTTDEITVVETLLEEQCADNLPFCESYIPEDMERIRLAALKLSQGSINKLESAVELAKTDWRDLLMSAGFGHDIHAHKNWKPDPV